MTEAEKAAPDPVRTFARRLRENADRAEALKFSVANLSTLPIADCRAMADWMDSAMQDAMAQGGAEPRGCPTPGACSCLPAPEVKDAPEACGENVITLGDEEYDKFIEALANPKPPTEALRRLMAGTPTTPAPASKAKVMALDLATLLNHAFACGALGGAWTDYDCTYLDCYHRVAEACGVPAEYYAAPAPAAGLGVSRELEVDGFGKLPVLEVATPAASDELVAYDAGLLNDHGGGNVEWWQDYIRAELGRAHDFYVTQREADAAEMERKDARIWELANLAGQQRGRAERAEARATAAEAERDALREVLREIANAYTAHGYSDAMDAVQALKDTAREALK